MFPTNRFLMGPYIDNTKEACIIAVSDDECVQKLAALIEHRDTTDLSEIVALIARLAATIE
jgi:hypothetical protein